MTFSKKEPDRAPGSIDSARRGSIPRARNRVDEYRVHVERWGGGLRRDTPALTYAERPVQGSHGEKRGVVPPGDGLHVDLNHLSRPFALPRLFSRNISEATSQRRPRALRRATRGQQWLSPLRERLHFARAATRFEILRKFSSTVRNGKRAMQSRQLRPKSELILTSLRFSEDFSRSRGAPTQL